MCKHKYGFFNDLCGKIMYSKLGLHHPRTKFYYFARVSAVLLVISIVLGLLDPRCLETLEFKNGYVEFNCFNNVKQ